MKIIDLIRQFKDKGIDISLRGNDLEIHYQGEGIQDELLAGLKKNKAAIIDFLRQVASGETTEIPATPIQPSYPLSSSQRRMWLLSQLEEGNIVYNMPNFYVFEGNLNVAALEGAFIALTERHEIMRTIFREDGSGEIRQFVRSPAEAGFRINYRDLRRRKKPEKVLKELLKNEFSTPFDLSAGPLLRVSLYNMEDDKWVLACTLHHIIGDGWSMNLFVNELFINYNAYCKGQPDPLAPLRIQYKDYAVWQQAELSGEKLDFHRQFWLKQFDGELPVLELPADRPRPAIKTYKGEAIHRVLDPRISRNIRLICQRHEATLFMGLLAAVNVLLYRYTGHEDIIIGSPIAGRVHRDLEDQIGVYVNTLAFRCRFAREDSYHELLEKIKQISFGAFEHAVYPFDDLVESLDLPRDMSRNALFNVLIGLHNHTFTARNREVSEGLKISRYEEIGDLNSEFDLCFDFMETGDDLSLTIKFNSDIYDRSTIGRMAGHFERLLNAIIEQPSLPIRVLDYLDTAERQQLLVHFNDTAAGYPKDRTLAALFEEQVLNDPDGTALVFDGQTFTRNELNERSNRLAHYLRKKYGIAADDLLGIKLARSEWMIIAIMGVLKSGGAYVPIDPEFPQERIDYILEDSGCKLVIDDAEISRFLKAESKYSRRNPASINGSANLAYVIYTSGSTGKPKGCMLEHKGVVNRLEWMWQHYKFSAGDTILQKTAYTFDVSVWELFLPLCWGAGMVLCQKQDSASPARILSLLEINKVTCVHFVPGMLNAFLSFFPDDEDLRSRLKHLRLAISSGEALPMSAVRNWYDKTDVPLHNLYGPTEASVDVTFYATSAEDSRMLIGRPIWNTQIYILDEGNQPAPLGVTGEICIGGDGLARGYLKKPELTTEKFIASPFEKGRRIYRTGDIGRWLADGNIEFTGRKDDQVKIRGYRIEPGEIAAELLSHPAVKQAAVLAGEDSQGDKYLAAYYVMAQEHPVAEAGLRAYLEGRLPDYMVPLYYIRLDTLPLTPNGKINRKALPEQEGLTHTAGTAHIGPGNDTEEKLALIWQQVLGKDKIGIKDNFFASGGHSLKVIRLAGQIHRAFGVKIELRDLFTTPVLEDQARLVGRAGTSSYTPIVAVAAAPDYPVSPSQRRLWILSQFELGNVAYNMPGSYVIEGNIEVAGLEYAFEALMERHEILRTVFKENDNGEIRQVIRQPEETGFRMTSQDLREIPDRESQVRNQVEEIYAQPFDLSAGPLLRVSLWQVEDNKYILAYVLHHVIGDGWSMDILKEELWLFYQAYVRGESPALPPLRIQYKDFVGWQLEQLSGERLESHKAYWLRHLEGYLPTLELPADKLRPALKTYTGGVVNRQLSRKVSTGIKTLCQEKECTIFMGLLAAVNVLLYQYTGQDDIIAGSLIAGRDHGDLERQIGCYVNTLVWRTRLKNEDNFLDILEQVKKITLDAYEHQVYPFDELVDALNVRRDMSRNPLFDVMVMLQNAGSPNPLARQEPQDIRIAGYQDEANLVSKFDLTFSFEDTGADIYTSIIYNSDIYSAATADRLAGHLEDLLAAMLQEPSIPFDRLDYLKQEEKDRLLYGFNGTDIDYPQDRTITDLWEEQVEKTPDSTALVFGDTRLTYRELNARSNQLANYLRHRYDIRPDDLVGLRLDRGEGAIIAMLGILKSGGAYVPMDPSYPREWQDYVMTDSGCKAVIDEAEMERFGGERETYEEKDVPGCAGADNLAYVIYTSGSTGRPKGVMIGHRGVVNLVTAQKRTFGIGNDENILQFSTLSFDASVEQIFIALASGARLTMIDRDTAQDPGRLEDFIDTYKVTHIHMVPDLLKMLQARKYKSLRRVISGGDRCPKELAQNWSAHHRFYNEYGPTETTVTSVELLYDKSGSDIQAVPIGRPIANTRVYILKGNLLAPLGIAGEIAISGPGLARGYLNREQLTAQKFSVHPLTGDQKLYRTGDMGRWLENGNIEFLGRIDDQVKIRGHRIELGEIEHALQACTDVDSAFVAVKAGLEEVKELVAYVVSKKELNSSDLRTALSMQLPEFMIPSHFVRLEQIPLTPSGKVDRRALQEPGGRQMTTGVDYVAPRNGTEAALATIWQGVLGLERVGMKDNFFDLGGHSLKATWLANRVYKQFGIRIKLRELFANALLEEQASLLRQTLKAAVDTIPIVSVTAEHRMLSPISYNQLDYLSEYKFGNDIVVIYHFAKDMDMDSFRLALRQMVGRHEILRTRFVIADGFIQQRIIPLEEVDLPVPRVTAITSDAEMKQMLEEEYYNKIDPYDFPLWTIKIYDQGGGVFHILATIHHIAIDAYSIGLMKEEFIRLYISNTKQQLPDLGSLPFQYTGFSQWQRNFLDSEEGERHKSYWHKRLKGFTPAISLSGFTNGDTRPEGHMMVVPAFIKDAFLADADNFIRENRLTRPALLMGALILLLNKLGEQKDITLVTSASGRNSTYYGTMDVAGIIGYFVNHLLVRNRINDEMTAIDFLKNVLNNFLDDLDHDAYPFSRLIHELPDVSPADALYSTVFFNFHNYAYLNETEYVGEKGEGLIKIDYADTIQYSLGIAVSEYKNCLALQLIFNRSLFQPSDAAGIRDQYFSILRQLIYASDEPVGQLKDRAEEKAGLLGLNGKI